MTLSAINALAATIHKTQNPRHKNQNLKLETQNIYFPLDTKNKLSILTDQSVSMYSKQVSGEFNEQKRSDN